MTQDRGSESAHLERLLDRVTDGFIGLDTDWQFTYLNETGLTVVCEAADETVTADELVGRNIWELLQAEQAECLGA